MAAGTKERRRVVRRRSSAARTRPGGAAPVTSTTIEEQVQDLQARVTAIEKYLQAASAGSDNSRNRLSQANVVYIGGEGGGR